MRKKIITTTTLMCSILVFTISASCNQSSGKKEDNNSETFEEAINEQQVLSGEEWLKSIFQCSNGSGYCFPDEEKVSTERFYEFFIESIGIYEYTMFETEDEKTAAEKAYKNKWTDFYPLEEEISYPFGRGNGLGYGDKLKNIIITPQSDSQYSVLIDYGDEVNSITEVTLIPNGNSYLIDYMKSEYIEYKHLK